MPVIFFVRGNKRLYIYLLHMYPKMVSVSLHTSYTFAISSGLLAK